MKLRGMLTFNKESETLFLSVFQNGQQRGCSCTVGFFSGFKGTSVYFRFFKDNFRNAHTAQTMG